jgi:cyanophycinase-like exopeptidase
MPLALIGGEEFSDGFEDVHARLLEDVLRIKAQANGRDPQASVVFLPTCAADDGLETVHQWCERARERLSLPGARVEAIPIANRADAHDPAHVRALLAADWIYLGGGHPHVGMEILGNTPTLDAVLERYSRGALLSGASAGAMLLCARTWVITRELEASLLRLWELAGAESEWDVPGPEFVDCLGLIPHALCWPHLNFMFSVKWLQAALLPPNLWMIGIDEQTALVNTRGAWEILGRGSVTLLSPDYQIWRYPACQTIPTLTPSRTSL